MAKTMSRRDFLRTTAVGAAALGAMSVLLVQQAGAEENSAPEQTAQTGFVPNGTDTTYGAYLNPQGRSSSKAIRISRICFLRCRLAA